MENAHLYKVWPTWHIYYRCDKIVKDYHEGDILWMGPSEQYDYVAEDSLSPDILTDSMLVYFLKRQIFIHLMEKPFVKALLHEGDYIGRGPCDIQYKSDCAFFYRYSILNQKNLSLNPAIEIEEDELGSFAKLWITMTLIINSQ